MFNTKPFYITLVRERTNETVKAELGPALTTIKNYDDKQQFMTMLGQETFWKKNRLDLWAALKTLDINDDRLLDDAIWLDRIAFQNTPIMLRTIKDRLKHETEVMIQQSRMKIKPTQWSYCDYNHIYQNGERRYVDRAVRIDVPNHYIRTEDIEAFDQELTKLLNKYVVKDPTRLRNGRQQFNYRTVAQRYVERVFGFKPEPKTNYYW